MSEAQGRIKRMNDPDKDERRISGVIAQIILYVSAPTIGVALIALCAQVWVMSHQIEKITTIINNENACLPGAVCVSQFEEYRIAQEKTHKSIIENISLRIARWHGGPDDA